MNLSLKKITFCILILVALSKLHSQDTLNRTNGVYQPKDTSRFSLVRMLVQNQDILIKIDSSNSNPYIRRGAYKRHLCQYEESIKDFSKAITLEKDSHLIAVLYYWIGGGYDRIFAFEKALNAFSKSIEIGKNNLQAKRLLNIPEFDADIDLSLLYYDRGLINNSLKRYNDAKSDFKNSIKADSTNSSPLFGIATAFEYENKFDSAFVYYKIALNKDTSNYFITMRVHNNMCAIYQKQEKYDNAIKEAIIALSEASKVNEFYHLGWLNLIESYKLNGDKDMACNKIKEYVKLDRYSSENEKAILIKQYCK